jgi:serine phosphatase RsbU (regulator of sigma subunit)
VGSTSQDGITLSEPSTRSASSGELSRLRGRLARARTLEDVSAPLTALLARVYRPGCRFELFLGRDGQLAPTLHVNGEARESRLLLASLRTRLLASARSLDEPQVLAEHETSGHRPVLSAPVLGPEDELAGLVVVEGAPHHPAFQGMELVALEGIAALISASLPSLHRTGGDEALERRALDREAACRVQRGFMSSRLPPGAGVTAYAEYRPAFEVGGDFYSVSYLGDRVVSATIGDVSGNGVSAALLMSRVTADVERVVAGGARPAAVLTAVNDALSSGASDMFVTAACARIDAAQRRLTVANAGHLPVIVRRASGEVFTFGGASGTPLGMLPCEYGEDELLLEGGDIILLFTDGLLEALDHPSGHRGLELLVAEVHAAGHDPAAIDERLRMTVDRARLEHVLDDVTWVGLQLAP